MFDHLEAVAQGQGGMVGLLGQEPVVEAAAVADPVTLGVEGQTGHQHQGGLVVGHGLIGDGLGDVRIARGDFADEIADVQKSHVLAVALGHGDPLAVTDGLLQHGHGAHLLVVGQVAVDGLGLVIQVTRPELLAQPCTGGDDLRLGHGSLLGADVSAHFFLIHWYPPSRDGTS